MARECGWTKDYIADNLTVPQILKYCEVIHRQKLRDAQVQAVSILKAVGAVVGSVPYDDFKAYVEFLSGTSKDSTKELDKKLKDGIESGLNIEDK